MIAAAFEAAAADPPRPPPMGWGPEDVRSACAWVADRAAAVRIDLDAIERLAQHIAPTLPSPPVYDDTLHFRGEAAATLAFVLCLDAVNFGSGYFPHLAKREGHSGYGTLASRLADRFHTSGAWTAADLTSLTPSDLRALLRQRPGNWAIDELMARYASSLQQLGRWIGAAYAGSFERLVTASDRSAIKLVRRLSTCPAFSDCPRYDGRSIPLLKRAQIAAWDLYLAFAGHGPGALDDIGCLTAFADNVVPHALRIEGVLHYANELARRIDTGELLGAGSEEEIELRACSVHAVELLAERIRQMGHHVYPALIDYILWNRPRDDRFRSLPRHRTRTTAY